MAFSPQLLLQNISLKNPTSHQNPTPVYSSNAPLKNPIFLFRIMQIHRNRSASFKNGSMKASCPRAREGFTLTVALNVNNILTFGAKPTCLSTLYSSRLLDDALSEKVIKGVLDGYRQCGCKFLGKKAIEKLNFYFEEIYDLGCCAEGIVKKDSVIDGKNIVAGYYLIGLPSSAVHWSGFSLVRRALAQSGLSLKDQLPGGSGKPITLGEALVAPTVIYVKQVLDIISKGGVKGIAHFTDGGLMDNIRRVLPKGLGATIYQDIWEVPAVLKWIQEVGRIEDAEMRRTFDMGIGMVLVVSPEAASRILQDATSKTLLEQ